MRNLSTIAQRLADEIRAQDWSDAHSRADGARHDRQFDRTRAVQLDADETEIVRMNVIWVVGQALADDDPNFDVRSFAEEAGANGRWLQNKDGSPNRGLESGLRPTRSERG